MTGLSTEDEQAVRELVRRADDAQSDVDLLPELHTAEMVIVNIAGRRLFGRAAFTQAMAAALGSGLKDVRTSVEIVDVRALTDDVVVVSCVKTVYDERPDTEPDALPATGALTYVVRRTSAGWRLALAQTTPIR
ncbi:SgcJ/EcaC family oxidoreductase [Kribbella turkmenica]|uniref:SgcJ/EcaC family oxidoreductase n=1 Tax=Kribbella turkmenica TaxID=2530375 RepID=A0A4R4WP53_9ACTN|nr:SgcJ/EcaC family oxidoreductase [Kribbella turkmenica]TDD18683.1 SgcJ/EcaC family oxidoreductase [Kribbella turkmenica]